MGLDMYLYRAKKIDGATANEISKIDNYFDWKDGNSDKYSFEEWCGGDINDIDIELADAYSKVLTERYSYWDKEKRYPRKSIMESVGYWRKANAIHNWIVENVQDGIDDCDIYEFGKRKIKTLLSLCEQVRDSSKLAEGMVKNGYQYTENGEEPIYEEGKYIVNPEVAEELLPTSRGFFFGSTDYDQWYMDDIIETIDILTKVLEETDFNKEMIMYSSSW